MLIAKEIEIMTGRGIGGDFMRVTHLPTGISRGAGPPLKTPWKTRQELLRQLESDLIGRGLSQYVIVGVREKVKSRPKK